MFPLNVPNALTLFRILLVPVLVVALLEAAPETSILAAVVFAVAAITDGLDGYIARTRREVTTFGKVMDPIADKLLIAAALITLVSLERIEPWIAMVIIAREFAVSGLRVAAGQQGLVIPASSLGKLKTGIQVVAILAVLATSAWWADALLYVAAVITIVSGADYFLNFRRRIEETKQKETGDAQHTNGGPPREPAGSAAGRD